MGLFAYLCGTFHCARCESGNSACIQTKLFFADELTSSKEYRIHDTVVIDGLDDYLRLYDGGDPNWLTVVMGDWECTHCGLNYQWAKVGFKLVATLSAESNYEARIESIDDFVPSHAASFAGINYIEEDLARLADYPAGWLFEKHKFISMNIDEKILAIIQGYNLWHRDMNSSQS